jgi:cell division protein FtsI/penicillin-binding protein 2
MHPALSTLPLPKVHQRPLLTWIAACAVLLGLIAAILFVAGARIDDQGTNYYVPEGYRKNVTSMAKVSAIRHDRNAPSDPRQILPPWGRMIFDADNANDRQEQFFQESKRLQTDLREFNETGGGFFEVRLDGKIYIARQYHNFALPYPKRPSWRGSFSLAGEKLPSLVSDGLYLGFSSTDENGAPSAEDYRVLRLDAWSLPAKNQSHFRAKAFELSGDESPLARLTLVGEHVVLQLTDTAQCEVKLNGDVINRSGSDAVKKFMARREDLKDVALPNNAAPLRDGDRLRIRHLRTGREIALRYGRYAGGMVSRRWLEDGREVNLVDPELAAELPYFQQLQDSLNRFIHEHPKPDQIEQPNIRLSLDRALHSSVNRIFLDTVRGFDARRSSVPNIQLEPACICIINALNGDVLAMPSYPAPADIAAMRQRAQTGSLPGVTDAKLRRLGLNQNLTLNPIGSTTKPLLASAIWDTNPELSRLAIDEPAGGRSVLLGYKLAAPYSTVGPRHVDSNGFLRMSSNDYTLHLGLLMLAKGVTISASGTPVFPSGKADLSAFFRGDTIPGGLDRPDVPAFSKLAECYDVGLVQKLTDGPAAQWDLGVLAPMLHQIGVKDASMQGAPESGQEDAAAAQMRELVYNSFSSVLPERANLQLDTVSSVRGKYTSMLLGSGTNYWSNLKLAEAYARLGTGRKIQARLTVDPSKETKLEDFPELPLKQETFAKVHAGMQQCAEGVAGSTAERISDSIKKARAHFATQGLTLFAIAKTGTATRRSPVIKRGVIIEDKRECAAFCLYLELRDKSGTPVAALSSATYLQDRAATKGGTSPKNSAVAVQLTEDFFPELVAWLESQPGVKKAVAVK